MNEEMDEYVNHVYQEMLRFKTILISYCGRKFILSDDVFSGGEIDEEDLLMFPHHEVYLDYGVFKPL